MVEYRSVESGEHVKRVQDITRLIIDKLCSNTYILKDYSPEQLTYIVYAAALHDIGKVGIPDNILLKPGRFTDEEYDIMKTHTEIGAKMAEGFYMGENKEFGQDCKDVCLYHHEKWDGSGYPKGLKETEIPISARIVAAADAFDAIISPRVYKEGKSIEEVFEILKKDSGKHFDPQIVEAMLGLKNELKYMYERSYQ